MGRSDRRGRLVIEAGTHMGRCRLVSQIGQGSMGVVWEAWHTTLGIPVAVKLLRHPENLGEAAYALKRFRMEAQITARINHPSVVRVLDFGEEDRPYLVMELVRGPDLQAWMNHRGIVDEILALKVAGHVGIGLAAMHQCGVIHRDLKPSNILISEGSRLKITDLGLARSPGDNFRDDQIAGTPMYLAPECLDSSAQTDTRSDLYALGVILFRMVLGKMPFSGSTHEVLRAQIWNKPDWTIPVGSQIDAGTLFIARRLMEKDPRRRLQTALELVQACREQVARLESRLAADPAEEEPRSVRRPLLRDRLASLRQEELENSRKNARSLGRLALWLVGAGLLLLGGFFVGRL